MPSTRIATLLRPRVGESPRIATEFYVPLDYAARWFVMPQARLEVRNVPVIEDRVRVAEYRLSEFEYGLDIGHEFSNWGELRAGVRRSTGRSRVRA